MFQKCSKNLPSWEIMGTFKMYQPGTLHCNRSGFFFNFTGWEHCDPTAWEYFQFLCSVPIQFTVKSLSGIVCNVPKVFLMGTLWLHNQVHCQCTGYLLPQQIAGKIAWNILNVPAVYQAGTVWVHCPWPCSVITVYWPGTLHFVPSVYHLWQNG